MEKTKGLVIRFFQGGYFLCDGMPPIGIIDSKEIFVGHTVKWFETYEEANQMRIMIDKTYI